MSVPIWPPGAAGPNTGGTNLTGTLRAHRAGAPLSGATLRHQEITLAERLYECMFLLDSGKFAQDRPGTEEAVKGLLDKCGGEILAAAPWQDGKLPYQIEGHKKGCHYLTYVKMDGSQVGELARLCKLSELVLRHLVIDHTDHGGLFHEKLVPALQSHVAGSGEEEPRQEFRGGRGRW